MVKMPSELFHTNSHSFVFINSVSMKNKFLQMLMVIMNSDTQPYIICTRKLCQNVKEINPENKIPSNKHILKMQYKHLTYMQIHTQSSACKKVNILKLKLIKIYQGTFKGINKYYQCSAFLKE